MKERLGKKQSVLARDVPSDLRDYVRNHLGMGWADFVESSLGIRYPGVKKRLDWTREAVISEIRRRKASGLRLNYQAVSGHSQAVIHQARKFFGSWRDALAAAGV